MDGAVYRILPTIRTGQGSHPQNMRFVKAGHGVDDGHSECVLGERAGFIHAQHIDACRFIYR
jgi:hypothetical protein